MNQWDKIYLDGSIHTKASRELISLVPILKEQGVKTVLDVGCGTGRHSKYLSEMGFQVYGIDLSEKAIHDAIQNKNGHQINL